MFANIIDSHSLTLCLCLQISPQYPTQHGKQAASAATFTRLAGPITGEGTKGLGDSLRPGLRGNKQPPKTVGTLATSIQ